MAIVNIPLGPSAFLSENCANLVFDDNTAEICKIQYLHNGETITIQDGFIIHLGITYSGNSNCPNQRCSNWPFYFSLEFTDGTSQEEIYLNKRGILDIQGVQIKNIYIHKVNMSGENNSLGFEPSKLNIEFEWKKA